MDLALVRAEKRPDGIFSELRDPGGDLIAVALEHAYFNQFKDYEPKLPDGNFKCVRGMHRLKHMTHDFETFEITGVPGHSNILFHQGNFNLDSDGCVLLGANIAQISGQQAISQSRVTFNKFMKLQSGVDEFMLSVKSD